MIACAGETPEQSETAYAAFTISESSISTQSRYPATIRGRVDVQIYPQVSGKITELCITEGQQVKKGQTLFILDQKPYIAALNTAQADLDAAVANVASSELTLDGKQKLFDKGIISDLELQRGVNDRNAAVAARDQAAAQLDNARNNLSYTIITAPTDGVVGTLPYRVGTLVGPDAEQPLTTISDNSTMNVYFSLPENAMIDLYRTYGSTDKILSALPDVRLFLNDGSEYDIAGRIETISGVLDAATGSVSVRAVFANPKGLLHSGGTGNVALVSEKEQVITIPQSATYELQDKIFVYRYVNGCTQATKINATAVADRNLYIVTAGLNVGDTIIAEGVGLLQDGMPIKIKDL